MNDYFSHIALINLKKREDRKRDATKVLDDFGIKYELWEATDNTEKPCEGLVDSMQRYFNKSLREGAERCLIFEDDILPLVDKDTFTETINSCIALLPNDWDLFYLGGNVTSGFDSFHSANLLTVKRVFATHATAYSKRAMEFIVKRSIKEPVDNCLVRDFQPYAKCFISYPMLMTQKPNHSDIGNTYTDWSRFLEIRYDSEFKRFMQSK